MSIVGILLAHSQARKTGKPPFFFSRFNFERMKEMGNTHFCFDCGGDCGFKPGPNGEIENSVDESKKWNPMEHHNTATHTAVIGNADKYSNPWDWLEKELPADFPYTVTIPSV
jgi:hypothetical protein